MGKIISIVNPKGGVGKTMTTQNLGAALALCGKKVLMVDIDPQCNLTTQCNASDYHPTISEIMYDVNLPIVPMELAENYHLIPAAESLDQANVDLGNMDEEEAEAKVEYWNFVKENPKYKDDFNQSRYEKYKDFAEPADIPLGIFVQYVNRTSGIETIKDEWGDEVMSVREQVLDVIDSLDLTWQQKDALYLAHGYAEGKIFDVPW